MNLTLLRAFLIWCFAMSVHAFGQDDVDWKLIHDKWSDWKTTFDTDYIDSTSNGGVAAGGSEFRLLPVTTISLVRKRNAARYDPFVRYNA